jgi:hypothetical protein
MPDMEVIVRRQDHARCASITCMVRHYVARTAHEGIGNLAASNALPGNRRDSHGYSVAPVGRAPVASAW